MVLQVENVVNQRYTKKKLIVINNTITICLLVPDHNWIKIIARFTVSLTLKRKMDR